MMTAQKYCQQHECSPHLNDNGHDLVSHGVLRLPTVFINGRRSNRATIQSCGGCKIELD